MRFTAVQMMRGACIALLLALVPQAFAQPFPTKPVRFVLGPGQDMVARLVSQKLSDMWHQQVIVDQRPGGGGINSVEVAGRAAADGYTWLLTTAVHTINPGLFVKPPYDIERDFAPVTLVGTAAFLLVVHPSLPAKSVQDLIGLAREKPGQINFSSSGVGTPPHLAAEMLKSMAKIELYHVPYKSVAVSIPDLLSGQVPMSFMFTPTVLPHVQSGKVRALAVTSAKRSQLTPDLPTVAESGLPGFEVIGWNAVHVPRGTPKPTIDKISADIVRVVRLPEVRDRMLTMGFDAAGMTPEQFAAFVRADVARWKKVIREARIPLQ